MHSTNDLYTAHETIDAAFLTLGAKSCWDFVNQLVIPSQDKGITLYRDVMADFQAERFQQIIPSMEALTRRKPPPCRRFWWEATKGAAKDADLAILILWTMIAAKVPLKIQVGAGDRDQAAIVKERAEHLLAHNPWLAKDIDIQRNVIKCHRTKCICVIESADAGTIHGGTPDLLILNELHVTDREFADALVNNAHKVSRGVLVIATNAGFLNTWQWQWRENAIESPHWETSMYSQPSPWTSKESLEDARRMNTDKGYKRLWLGVWTTEEGEGLPVEDIEWMMAQHDGPLTDYDAQYAPYIGGLDFGLKHDHAAFVIVGCDLARRRYRIATNRRWKPRDFHDGKISPNAVQKECWELARRFQIRGVAYDTYQFEGCAEWISSQWDDKLKYHCPAYGFPSNADNQSTMASSILTTLREKELEGYDDKDLKMDLLKLQIEEQKKGFGRYKLTASKDELTGHADEAIALSIALPFAIGTMKSELGLA